MRPFSFSHIAQRQVDAALDWWAENTEISHILAEELNDAIDLIRQQPGVGHLPSNPTKLPGVRRWLLSKTQYHLYYFEREDGHIFILRLWHARRKRDPKL